MCLFVLFVEPRTVAFVRVFQPARNGYDVADGRHVDQSADLEFVEIRESFDRSVPSVVAYGSPPGLRPGVAVGRGCRFGHSEGNSGGRVEEPAAVDRPDVGVYIIARSFFRPESMQGESGKQQCRYYSDHTGFVFFSSVPSRNWVCRPFRVRVRLPGAVPMPGSGRSRVSSRSARHFARICWWRMCC